MFVLYIQYYKVKKILFMKDNKDKNIMKDNKDKNINVNIVNR